MFELLFTKALGSLLNAPVSPRSAVLGAVPVPKSPSSECHSLLCPAWLCWGWGPPTLVPLSPAQGNELLLSCFPGAPSRVSNPEGNCFAAGLRLFLPSHQSGFYDGNAFIYWGWVYFYGKTALGRSCTGESAGLLSCARSCHCSRDWGHQSLGRDLCPSRFL